MYTLYSIVFGSSALRFCSSALMTICAVRSPCLDLSNQRGVGVIGHAGHLAHLPQRRVLPLARQR